MKLEDNIIGFHHVSIKAEDIERCIQFYEKLGFQVLHEWSLPEFNLEKCVMMFKANIGYYLEICDKNAQIPTQGRSRKEGDEYIENALLHICFIVRDARQAMNAAIEAGAKPLSNEVWEIDLSNKQKSVRVKNALVYSPNGEVVEFLEDVSFFSKK